MEPTNQLTYSQRMDLSARLDQAMKAAGYASQTALSRASGVSQSAVNRILKRQGKQGPDTATVAKLADACGVTTEWLISGIGASAEEPERSKANFALVYVSQVELAILTRYREANIAGQHLIEDLALSVSREVSGD